MHDVWVRGEASEARADAQDVLGSVPYGFVAEASCVGVPAGDGGGASLGAGGGEASGDAGWSLCVVDEPGHVVVFG